MSCVPEWLQESGFGDTRKAGKFLLKNLANPAHKALKRVLKNDQILNPEFLRDLTVPQFESIFAVYRTTDKYSGLFAEELRGGNDEVCGNCVLVRKA